MTTSFAKSRMKILLLEGVHDRAVENFKRHGYTTIERHKKALAGDELEDAVADVHFVGIRSRTRLTAEVIAAAPKLMAVGAFCIGTNQIDLDAAMMRGVPVFNAPFSNTRSVAELVLAEIIFLLRGIPAKNALLHRGVWAKSADDAREVRGKTLGIVGYGNIGTQLSVMAEALGMDVCFYDVVTKLPLGNARMMPSLEELLEVADVVTLHVPETPLTQGMMGARAVRAHEEGGQVHQRLARHRRGHRGGGGALEQQAHRGRRLRRLPRGAGGQRRGVRLPAAPVRQRHPDPAHRGLHPRGPGQHRHRGLGEARALQRQRLDAVRGELPGGGAARAPGQPPPAAHPQERARAC